MNSLAKIYRRPLDFIDSLLDGVTSYRLLLYFLLTILGWATIVSFDNKVPYSWYAIILSAGVLVIACRAFGELFSRTLKIARNFESDYITALILSLIMIPATDAKTFAILAGAGFAAIASKYLLTIGRQHIFNPAAAGAVVSGLAFHRYAGWWVGTSILAPIVIIGGLLIVRKMKRFLMVLIFLVTSLAILFIYSHSVWIHLLWPVFGGTPLLFLAFIMLIEPLTSPDEFIKYVPYSILVGILYSVYQLHVSPEEALLIGNVLAYALVRSKRLRLDLTKTTKEADGIYSFDFNYHGAMDFKPGQYLEWTLPMSHSDSRGNRRYFTLSSSPTEHHLSFTARIPRKPSYFKKALKDFKPDDKILASHLGGSFNLVGDTDQKLAFIAGGIGVTPFRSMIKYMVDKKQERDVSLLYVANKSSEFAFTELFVQARKFGVETSYLETAKKPMSGEDIVKAVPDYKERLFYLSGPYGFVKSARNELIELDVSLRDIKSDYFPGYS